MSMLKEKPYRITNVKVKKESNSYELQIWLKLLDNTKKVTTAIAGVSIIDNGGHPIELLVFSGGTHRMIRSIGASDRHQEYCFPLRLHDATASKLLEYKAVCFNVEIENSIFNEAFRLNV